MKSPKPVGSMPLRFAHPYFGRPQKGPHKYPKTILDYIQGTLNPIPAPKRAPEFGLSEVIGALGTAEIEASGSIEFHTVGDTGLPPQPTETPQEWVAAAMASDYNIAEPSHSPAFLFHLGDVVYGPLKDQNYRGQFYEPYKHYPGKIIAIPGNHDGETFAQSDPVSLRGYWENFCADSQVVPPVAGSIFRETMTQPGAYWLLDAPFIQIIGLYSNTAENPGFISGPIPGEAQSKWLLSTLKTIAQSRTTQTRKALAIATHHPPFSSGGHTGSAAMLAEIDSHCQTAGIYPDIFFSGHSHSYQRYTRFLGKGAHQIQVPYLVVGCGGHGDQPVQPATHHRIGDNQFEASYRGYGYALVKVSAAEINIKFYSVASGIRAQVDAFSVDLTTNRVS